MSDGEFALFRTYVERECAISMGQDKKYLIEARLGRLLVETGATSYTEFYRRAVYGQDVGLRNRIIEAITTNETLWFRDTHPFVALRDEVLVRLATQPRRAGAPIRIWSAGCSTGQEPYSVAMIIDDMCRRRRELSVSPDDFEIVATDISSAALTLAQMGRYDRIAMNRGLGEEWAELRARYFETRGAVSEVIPEIRRRVRFIRLNLQDDFVHLGRFHLTLLRYVLIYFSSGFKRALTNRVARSLEHGGLLVLGAAETLGEDSGPFHAERVGRSYFNRLDKHELKP